MKSLFDSVFHNQDKVPLDLVEQASFCASTFTAIVAALRDKIFCPNPRIIELADLLWELVGNKVTPFAVTTELSSLLGFWTERISGQKKGVVMCHPAWHQAAMQNIIMQAGGVVYIASQARDYYNDKFEDRTAMLHRASAFEADFLLTLKDTDVFRQTVYQQGVMKNFPEGLRSLRQELWYESKPFSV